MRLFFEVNEPLVQASDGQLTMKLKFYSMLADYKVKVESFEKVAESKVNVKKMSNVFGREGHASE